MRDRRIELRAARSAFLGTHMKFDIVCAKTEDVRGKGDARRENETRQAVAIDRYHGHVRLHLSIRRAFVRGKRSRASSSACSQSLVTFSRRDRTRPTSPCCSLSVSRSILSEFLSCFIMQKRNARIMQQRSYDMNAPHMIVKRIMCPLFYFGP